MKHHQITGTKPGVTRFAHHDAAVMGFDGYWCPVMLSGQLGDKPLPVREASASKRLAALGKREAQAGSPQPEETAT